MSRPINWQAIRMRWESGESGYAISKSLKGRPSRQQVSRRCKSENWERRATLPSQARTDLTSTGQGFRQQVILDALAQGASLNMAAQAAGISRRTLQNYRTRDADFARACETARASRLVGYMATIDRAAQQDWKAASYALERAPETREQFAIHDTSGNKLSIVINVPRGLPETPGVTIEGETLSES